MIWIKSEKEESCIFAFFPKDYKSLKTLDIQLREVGAK